LPEGQKGRKKRHSGPWGFVPKVKKTIDNQSVKKGEKIRR